MTGLKSLLYSRKFWLGILDVVQIVVLNYLNVPQDIWQSIHAVLLIVISAIAVEDFASKLNGD